MPHRRFTTLAGLGVIAAGLLAMAPAPAAEKPKQYSNAAVPPAAGAPATPTGSTLSPVSPEALLGTFRSFVGIKEQPPGSNNGPMVDKFNRSCGLEPKEHAPWCAAVTRYGYEVNGAKGRPGAYSPDWYRKNRRIPADQVVPGDVGLIWFPSKGRYAHTIAAIEKVNRSGRVVVSYTTLEGNTNAQGSREGDQFARRVRPAESVVAVRWWK